MTFVDVILPLSLPKRFTYLATEEYDYKLEVGKRVAVQFGKRKVFTGVIGNIHENPPQAYEAKPIEEVLDASPIITSQQLQFFNWISNYYLCTEGEVLKAALPSAFLLESETIIQKHPNFTNIAKAQITDDHSLILDALDVQSSLKLTDIMAILGKKTIFPVLNEMMALNLIIFNQELNKQYKPKLVKYLRINPTYYQEDSLNKLLDELQRAPKQKEVLLKLFSIKASTSAVKKSKVKQELNASDAVLKSLISKGIILEEEQQQDRVQFSKDLVQKQFQLSDLQGDALHQIKAAFLTQQVCLFQGVTSSGKTEIYIRLIEEQIQQGKQVLYLLPEIALTTQLISRLQDYFGDQVIVFHSKFSVNERVEAYKHVLNNTKGKIIIGARSSIFLPFQNLGLVIVDESHEASFKQFDPAPRYQARDAAVVLAHQFNANALLGTATPSLESVYNVKYGKYAYVKLTKRFGEVLSPKINLIDLQDRYKKKKMKGHFSEDLILKMQSVLEQGEQVILFQNRRGYSPILECNSCGNSPQCPNCDVSLTYHKHNNTLRCHYCGFHMAMQVKCLACGSKDLSTKGFGTEQIETEAKHLFPEAKVKRMDLDTTRAKHAYANLIAEFESGEIDILVGTQMLSKGLDFRDVNLVGVLNADSLLNFPDFRAHERCFQLLTQVAGRAGRTKKQGEVLIQSFNPHHQVLQQVTTYNYKDLFKEQLYERKQFNYPPFYRLVRFTLKSRDYNRVNESSEWLATYYKQIFKNHVLGPEFPPVLRIRNQYHKHILLKIPPNQSITKTKNYIDQGRDKFEAIGTFKSVQLVIDVDPY